MLDRVLGSGVGERLEVHVVRVGTVALAAHLDPEREPCGVLLFREDLPHRRAGAASVRSPPDGSPRAPQRHACRAMPAIIRGVPRTQERVPEDAHEWVSFDDPDEERTWLFDVTFLASSWTCIFGRGCQGVLTGPTPELEQGCCSYGAHFTGRADARTVERAAATLDPDLWQFHRQGRRGVVKKLPGGGLGTRIVEDACIFLNRPGFPAGSGCALHLAALAQGRSHVELKPEVCWQLPLRREDETSPDGRVTSVVRQWDRRHWGAGGDEFHWWCTEDPAAFTGSQPVYVEMRRELETMSSTKVYRMLAAYLDERRSSPTSVALPHPTVRR